MVDLLEVLHFHNALAMGTLGGTMLLDNTWGCRFLGIVMGCAIAANASCAVAQSNIVPDNTLNTENSTLTPNFNGQPIEVITGGAIRGQNLFHSFQQFNVSGGRGAYFFSPSAEIQNILARVTGSDRSSILGLLGTFGESQPNLFLINPNGIIFGPNASLDVDGSFVATTASAIAFPNGGEFSLNSAVEPGNSLLSINPSALLFNQIAAQPITNESRSPFPKNPSFIDGLRATDGKSLLLVGGDVRLNGGFVQAVDGHIELGGVAGPGTVGLNVDGNNLRLSFPNNIVRAEVSLTNKAVVNASGKEGGEIQVHGGRVTLADGSSIFADTLSSQNGRGISVRAEQLDIRDGSSVSASTTSLGNAGNIQIQASDGVAITGEDSLIGSFVTRSATGRGGDVTIDTTRLIARNGAQVIINTQGKGRAGNLSVNASDSVAMIGTSADGEFSSALFTRAESGSEGDAGNITINTQQFQVLDGAQVSTRSRGKGLAGNLTVNASDSVELIGTLPGTDMRTRLITVGFSSSKGAGDLTINTKRLIIRGGAIAVASTFGEGQAGNLTVNAPDFVEVSGISTDGRYRSALVAETSGSGSSRDLTINTGRLTIRDGANVSTSSFRDGRGGNLTVNASDSIEVIGLSGENGFRSGLFTEAYSSGAAGSLTLTTKQLSIRDGAGVSSATFGEGQAGNLTVNALMSVEVSGISADGRFRSALTTETQGTKDAGDLVVNTKRLNVQSRAAVSASTRGRGNAGKIFVQASESVDLTQGYISSEIGGGAVGNAGDITIQTRSLTLTDGGQIAASVFREQGNIPGGQGKGGNIQVNATDSVKISGIDSDGFSSGLFTNTERGAIGPGGNIEINTGVFRIEDGAVVTAQTLNKSNGGNVIINANRFEAASGGRILTGTFSSGKAGNIAIATRDSITMTGSSPNFDARFNTIAGEVVENYSLYSGLYADTDSASTGQGGGISLTTTNLYLTNGAQISAQSLGKGRAGNITINSSQNFNANNGRVITTAEQGGGGNVNITTKDLRLRNNSDIRTNSSASDGGNIFLAADSIIALEDSDILAFAPEGQGGNITFNTNAFFSNPLFRRTPSTTDRDTLEALNGNNKVDVNASGTVSGAITGVPDITFLQNSLTELSQNPIDTNALIANSCIARTRKPEGTFTITGTGGLPNRPGDASVSSYPTGEVRNVQTENASLPWQKGDLIVEPNGVYKLSSGKLVLSRECP